MESERSTPSQINELKALTMPRVWPISGGALFRHQIVVTLASLYPLSSWSGGRRSIYLIVSPCSLLGILRRNNGFVWLRLDKHGRRSWLNNEKILTYDFSLTMPPRRLLALCHRLETLHDAADRRRHRHAGTGAQGIRLRSGEGRP